MPENPFDAAPPANPFAIPPDTPPRPEPLAAAGVVIDTQPGTEPTRIGAQVFISGRRAPVINLLNTRPELDPS